MKRRSRVTIPPRGYIDTVVVARRVRWGWRVTITGRLLEPDQENELKALTTAWVSLSGRLESLGCDVRKFAAKQPWKDD